MTITPDFGLTAGDYASYRAGFPRMLLDRLLAMEAVHSMSRVLDIGTGTGSLARLLAPRVHSVVGIDPSAPLLKKARELDRDAGLRIDYRIGAAEATGLDGGQFDVVTAGQCWHWFEADQATEEVRRLLRDRGRLVISHFDWIPLPGNVVAETESLIREYNPEWKMGGGAGLYPQWLTDVARGGFVDIETFSFDTTVDYPPEAWIGRVRASAGVGASLPPEKVTRFCGDLSSLLEREFPGSPLRVPHRLWSVVAAAPG